MGIKRALFFTGLLVVLSLLLAACGGSEATEAPPTEVAEEEHMDEHVDEDENGHEPEDHMAGAHDVPEDAAAVPNPFSGDDESTAAGADLYATSCAVCHGDTGEGDGPGATGMDPAPADLHEGHVQGLTDGALFYIISHGKPDTPMPAWEDVLDEDERWHVVNFLRTFQ
jgi:mono/diheme cytochrome c family protein